MARRMTARPRLIRSKSRRREFDRLLAEPSAQSVLRASIEAKKAARSVGARILLSVRALPAKIKPGRWHGPDCEKSKVYLESTRV